jgi:hypothetical protein
MHRFFEKAAFLSLHPPACKNCRGKEPPLIVAIGTGNRAEDWLFGHGGHR